MPPPALASVSPSAGSPPVNWSPSPSPPPPPQPPQPPPTPRRAAAPVASRRLACERCVRRLESFPGVEPRCVFRVGRVKCDYCVQVGHACKKVPQTLENAAGRLEALARRHRRGDNVSAAAVRESARLLSNRMILAGRQNRTQGGVAPSAPPAHPLAAVLGDLLEATRSLAESVSALAGTPTPVWSSLAQEDDSPSDGSARIENSASPQL